MRVVATEYDPEEGPTLGRLFTGVNTVQGALPAPSAPFHILESSALNS